jgi:hypothetical protein
VEKWELLAILEHGLYLLKQDLIIQIPQQDIIIGKAMYYIAILVGGEGGGLNDSYYL